MKSLGILLGIALAGAIANAAGATVLIQEDFESLSAGTILRFEPGWVGTTNTFRVADQPGLAASGSHYLIAPSLTGAGERKRFVWFDASNAFNTRPVGENTVVGDVKMFVPDVTESTYGGMFMFDQGGNYIGVIGLDMLSHKTLTSANTDINNIDVNINQYNDFQMLANFDSGLVTYRVNGTTVGSSMMSAQNLSAGFGDFDFYNNGFNATVSVPFRYDDYKVSVVPDPETYALLTVGFGLLGSVARRRRSIVTSGMTPAAPKSAEA